MQTNTVELIKRMTYEILCI